MPKRKADSSDYFRVAEVGTATKHTDGKWYVDARRKGIPRKHQRKVFHSRKDAKAHLETLKKTLKQYGQVKATNQDFFSDDELTQARILLNDFNTQHGLELPLNQIVELGVQAEGTRRASLSFPLTSDFIDEYLAFRATPQGKKRGGGKIHSHQLGQEKLLFKSVKAWIGHMRLNELFAPETRLKKIVTDKLANDLKQSNGREYSPATLKKNAKFIAALLTYALEEYPQIGQPNPLLTLHASFDKAFERIPRMFAVKDVERLFDTAASHDKWRDLIPFMAFIFFSGTRPSEVATQEKYRRFEWRNMNGWMSESKVSEGIIFKVPPFRTVDGVQKRMSKKNTWQIRDLVPAGVEWMRWYFEILKEESLPIEGKVKYSRRHWEALRKECKMFGENWEDDGARHTFASCAHAHWSSHYEHWLTHIGHRGGVLEKHYLSPDATPEDARYYFEQILPPNLKAEQQAQKERAAQQELAYEHARERVKEEYGIELPEDMSSFTWNDQTIHLNQFLPDWYEPDEEEFLF